MPGIAAGVDKDDAHFGDVLVADLSWDYGSGKLKVQKGKTILAPDPRPIPLAPLVKQALLKVKKDSSALKKIKDTWLGEVPPEDLAVHLGPVASGAAVLADESAVKEVVSRHRKLIGIEMKAYSLYYAAMHCAAPRPSVFALKSVCDYGDREKDDTYQPYAAYTSAKVLELAVNKYLSFER
jgi:nucleoside phosphorylase